MSLRNQLRDRPHAFELFQALRLLELEGLRLGVEVQVSHVPHLWHTASDLTAVEIDEQGRVRLSSLVFGLLGPSGPLPLRLTEDAIRQARGRRGAMADFLSLLGEAQLRAFYAAWRAGRLEMIVVGGAGQQTALRALTSGLDDAAMALRMVPQWRNAARGCEGLRATIHSLTGCPCEVEQLLGEWLSIPAELRSRTGSARLGVDTTVGVRQWARHSRIRIRLQVEIWAQLQDYIPARGAGFDALRRILSHYLLAGLVWTLDIVLPAQEVRGARLGVVGHVGQDAWLDQPRSRQAMARFGLRATSNR